MIPHLRRSRVTKALTDAGLAASFSDAEARLDAVNPCIVLGEAQAFTPAGQAAALTAIATAFKCFGRITLATSGSAAALLAAFPMGGTLGEAATALGAVVTPAIPDQATHLIGIGVFLPKGRWSVSCWWDRWLAGLRLDGVCCGDSRLGLAGVYAGALAVRQVFASVLKGPGFQPQPSTLSLWEPWAEVPSAPGPSRFTAPSALWMVGLGHLGQGFVWSLLMLPYREPRRAVLQDDQRISLENEPTSLLVVGAGERRRKVRLAAAWLEPAGWETEIIERRHQGDIALTAQDPPFLLTGLDDVHPRGRLAEAGFDYMIDAGIGHGPGDFDGLQIRVIPKGMSAAGLWNAPPPPRSTDALLGKPAYRTLDDQGQACGAYALAEGSVAVPFVGAVTGALTIAQTIRLAGRQQAGALIQIGLGAPELQIDGGRVPAPPAFLGGELIDLDTVFGPVF